MSKTLVIPGASYAGNALDRVTIGDSVPCMAVTLSEDTLTVSNLQDGSGTLTATLTPANTTDVLAWSSSDPSVATVSDGVVTAVGLGTATITATCGSASATCTVTTRIFFVDNVLKVPGLWATCDSYYKSGGIGLPYTDPSGSRGLIVSSAGTLGVYGKDFYPMPIPAGTSTVRVNVGSSGCESDCMMLCSQQQAVAGQPTVAVAIERVNASTSGTVLDYVIPDETGMPAPDCAIIVLLNWDSVTEQALAPVTVEFLA